MKRLKLAQEKTFVGPSLIWKRIAAFFIDILIINFVVLIPFRRLFSGIIPKDYSFLQSYSLLSSASSHAVLLNSVSIAISIFVILYFYLLERRTGQTIGKALMNIYVIGDGKAVKPWQILARSMFFIPVFPFFLLWVIDPLTMFFTRTNQRLSEILSKTRVVEMFSLE